MTPLRLRGNRLKTRPLLRHAKQAPLLGHHWLNRWTPRRNRSSSRNHRRQPKSRRHRHSWRLDPRLVGTNFHGLRRPSVLELAVESDTISKFRKLGGKFKMAILAQEEIIFKMRNWQIKIDCSEEALLDQPFLTHSRPID